MKEKITPTQMMERKQKEMTRILCKWNRREIEPKEALLALWELYRKEALKTWNDPLEKLILKTV